MVCFLESKALHSFVRRTSRQPIRLVDEHLGMIKSYVVSPTYWVGQLLVAQPLMMAVVVY